MPINKKLNLTFIHIPKTGGASIEKALYMQNRAFFYDVRRPFGFIDGIEYAPQHYTGYILKQKVPEFYKNSFKFTFVRNPYTRVLSEYMWQEKKNEFILSDFKEWLSTYFDKIDTDHKLPQHKFVPYDIDFIGKFENIEEDFRLLREKANISNHISLKHHNSSSLNKDEILNSLDQESLEIITNMYREDFIRFGYKILTDDNK